MGADAAGPDPANLSSALLGIEQIFGRDLPADPNFTVAVAKALDSLIRLGAQKTIEDFRSAHP